MIFKAADQGFQSGWFREAEIQAMWSAAGRPLPVPDNEPERPWLRERRNQDLAVFAYFGVVAVGIWMILRWGRRVWNRMSEV